MSAEQTLNGFEQGKNKIRRQVCLWVEGSGMEHTHTGGCPVVQVGGRCGLDKEGGGGNGERGALEDSGLGQST